MKNTKNKIKFELRIKKIRIIEDVRLIGGENYRSEPQTLSNRGTTRKADLYPVKIRKSSRMRLKTFFVTGLTVIISVAIIFTAARAGNLAPSSAPGSTMNSLADIAGAGFAAATHSLKAIYDKINGLAADIWNKPASDLTSTGSVGKLVKDNLDAAISSRSTLTQAQIISDNSPFQGANIGSILANTQDNLNYASSAANSLTGVYDAAGIASNAAGNVMQQLKFIRQNLGGYAFGSSSAGDVLTAAGGTYNAVNLIATNVRSGVTFGVSQTGTYGGGSWTYGSSDAAKVLTTADAAGTYNASNLSVGAVKSGTTFGVSLTGAYPSATYPLSGAGVTADLAASAGNISSANGAVEWWQSDGARQTATLDFPTLSNVCSSDTSNNSAGTLTVTAAYIGVGNTWCGTAGTLLANLFNGTSGAFTGGSQANGGADDYNNAGAAPADRYSKGWTQCAAGNNYCGTGLASADAKDDSAGLIWSLPCNGAGCASFSDASPLVYSWDSSAANNSAKTASQLCSAGSHTESGWSLPHQKQLMQAYIDGSYGNLEASGAYRIYWSATTISNSTTSAWDTSLSSGYTGSNLKTDSIYVRCVRPAN